MNLHRLSAWRNIALAVLLGLASSVSVSATVVRYDTTLGFIDVRLFDSATPLSVANFLNYANTDRWDGTFIHRSVPGFVIQGGGFSMTPDVFNTTQVSTDPPVLNEPVFSNLRGTIAYAKVGPPQGQPPNETSINSATSQWFFNLADNSANLDNQNGGFTVFGRVVGAAGQAVVDNIAALDRINAGGAFTNVPVTDREQVIAQQNITNSEAVLINDISVLDIPDGDYNFDGTVDAADLAIWEANSGSTTEVAADGNGNGIVDGDDYLIWQANLGATTASLGAVTANIPEPSTLALAACGLFGLLRRR